MLHELARSGNVLIRALREFGVLMTEPVTESAATQQTSSVEEEPWFTSRRWKLLAFYLGVPLVVALYGGLNNWQLLKQAGYLPGLFFYIAHAVPPWLTTCLTTFLVMWALKRWKPNPWTIMAIGSIIAAFITQPFASWLTAYYEQAWDLPYLHDQIAPMFSMEFWRYLISATAMWFLVNYVFDRFFGLPRYRYTIPRGYDYKVPASIQPAEVTSDPLPGFLERIPNRLSLDDVLAIKAEQHYIRVFTSEREYMVLYRFSDAVREMPEAAGMQVHRSYWVGYSGVHCIKPRVKKFSMTLTDGENVPVSNPYHAAVKEAAKVHGWKVIS